LSGFHDAGHRNTQELGRGCGAARDAAQEDRLDRRFLVASGVPALVLFSVGAVAATVGRPSWLVWMISIGFGFIQRSRTRRSQAVPAQVRRCVGVRAIAWVRYASSSRRFRSGATGWPGLRYWRSVGTGGRLRVERMFRADAAINTWHIRLLDLGAVKPAFSCGSTPPS